VIDLIITSSKLTTYVQTCDTLTHETVRSDHIAVYSDIALDERREEKTTKTFRCRKKVNWNDWRSETEELCREWSLRQHNDLEESYESFSNILEETRDKYMPEKTFKQKKKSTKPCWWNENVSISKKHLNYCQKTFKRRNTLTNKQLLSEAEDNFKTSKETAQEEWTENLLNQFEKSSNPREMWDTYRKLTKKPASNSILPLIDQSANPVFKPEEKCKILQERYFEAKHLDGKQFDSGWKRSVEEEIPKIQETIDLEEEEGINAEIRLDEVERAVGKLKRGKAPGPDGFYPELFIYSGDYFRQALTELFNLCWKQGKSPSGWKEALVKFLRKPGKKDYYTAASISLTQTICKLLESVVLERLNGFVESNDLLDQEQEGFRKNRSTTYAVGRLVQEVMEGYNQGQCTAAVFIDLASAYDSVWREGLVFELAKMDIKGRMWLWIRDFLSHRVARCMIDDHIGPSFQTNIGLPQGSGISPTLFNIFIKDMFEGAGEQHCKFADDGTTWATAKSTDDAIAKVCQKVQPVMEWCEKWRMNMNLNKTEATVFSSKPINFKKDSFIINNRTLSYNKTPKILGINLDEHMTFDQHIQQVERKASRTLRIIREVKGIATTVSTKKLLNLYKTMVRAVMEYGAFVWQGARNKTRLDAIQRKGLALCLNLPQTSGRETMEVAAGLLPIDLRLEEIAVRELAKIQAKKVTHPLKKKLEDLLQDETTPIHVSPLALAVSQAKDVETTTKVSTKLIEPELDYEVGSLYRSRTRPEYWNRLGSSKSRTKEQEELGKETILDLMMEAPQGSALAFTDGSCITNPGPCGAGAIIYPSEGDPVLLQRPVSRHGSILLAELVAILMVLEHILQYPRVAASQAIRIFCDSQTAVGVLTMGWSSNSHRGVIQEINKALSTLSQNFSYNIELLWTPGHAGLQGNDKADQLAKEGAKEALEMPEDSRIVTIQEIKDASNKTCLAKWQTRWENSSTGRRFYEFYPTVARKRRLDFPDKLTYNAILQLQTGYSKLNAYRNTTGQNISPPVQMWDPGNIRALPTGM